MTTEIETNSELDRAAEEFFQAAYRYREKLKKHAPQSVGGVIWVRRGNQMIAYSESARYTEQVCSMTHDRAKDELVFTWADETDE